jgi:alpha-2-macroglobulin
MKNRFWYGFLGLIALLVCAPSVFSQTRGAVVYSRIFTPQETAVAEYYSDARGAITFTLEELLEAESVLLGMKDWRNPDVPASARTRVVKTLTPENRNDFYGYGRLELGRLEEGVYMVRARQGNTESRALVMVSRLGLVTKRSPTQAITWTVDSLSGQPRAAKVYVLQGGKASANLTADAAGLARWKLEGGEERLYLARFGASWAIAGSAVASWNQRRTLGYVYTERPVYRPGDTVFVKGILRDGRNLQPRVNATVRLRVLDREQNTEVFKGTARTNDFGSFAFQTDLPSRARTGQYAVEARGEASGDEGAFFGAFKVEAYQKPEFAVTVNLPKKAVQGDRVTARVNAEYLFGGKVSNARVRYSVQRQLVYNYWWYANNAEREEYMEQQRLEAYQNGYSMDWYDWYQPPSETIIQESGRLNAQGELEISLPLSKSKDAQTYKYIVNASVEDETRQVVGGSATVQAAPSSLSVSVQTQGYAYRVGEDVKLSLRTRDLEEKGVAADVKLQVRRETWERDREVRSVVATLETRTDGSGVGTAAFKPARSGYYRVTATVSDAKGRDSSSEWSVWVTGSENEVWYYRFDNLEIKLDKNRYAPGDVVTVLIQNPFPNSSVLLTLEGAGVDSARVLRGKGSVLRHSFRVTATQAPNVFLTATTMNGGRVFNSQKRVLVDDPKRQLSLQVTATKPKFSPAETTTLQLKTIASSGAGVPAEVSVAVVDEGVYLVQADTVPGIAEFFHRPRGNVVGTQFSQNWYFQGVPRPTGALASEAAAAPSPAPPSANRAALDEAKASPEEPRVRQDFRDVALWRAQVQTDANGKATLELKFPDNLTTWRVTAKGMTKAGSAGETRKPLLVTQDIVARLGVPRVLVRGDSTQASLVVNNNLTDATDAKLELRGTGIAMNGATSSDTRVGAGGRGTLRVTLNADTIGTARLQGRALTGSASDALEIPVTVKPRGFSERAAFTSDTKSGAQTLEVTKDAALETARFTLLVTPSLTAAVSPALEYLVGYPYGCSEQTMSRFLPALLASRTLGANELGTQTVKKLPEYVKIGIERLESFQHEDGGWGFWQYDDSSLEMTAYVMGGLLRAKALDAKVSTTVLERGLNYLQTAANQERWTRADRAAAYLTLSIGGVAPLEAMRRFAARDGLEPSTLARLAIAFSRMKVGEDAKDALDRLKALRQENPRGVSWRNPNNREYWWSWDDNPVTTTAVALEAFARVEPDSPLLPKISAWLLAERQGARWVSTRDTAAVIEAALALNEDTNLQPTPITVLLNGEPVQELTIKSQAKLELMNAQTPLQTGKNTLEVRSEKRILYSADLEYVREPQALNASNKGIALTRTYEKLEAKFNEKDGTYTFVPRALLRGGSLEPVTVGEYVLVTLNVTAKDARYLLLSDAIPAGFKALETRTLPLEGQPYRSYWDWSWNYWFSGLDIRDDRVEVYAAQLNGTQRIQYLLRAETPGRYTALPTESFLMYEPRVNGRSSAATLTVRDRGQ